MRSRNFVIFAGAVAAVFVLALLLRQPVTQRAVIDDQNILVKSDYHVSTAHDGDLVVMGSTVAIDDDGSVEGNASLIGDNVTVAGTVNGGLTALGKNVFIDPTASINGHTALMGTNITVGGNISGSLTINGETITILPETSIDGSINVCAKSITDQRANTPAITCSGVDLAAFAPLLALRSGAQSNSHQLPIFALVLLTAFGGVLLTGMSVLSVTFFPRQISHIEEAMRLRPRSFVGVGIATYALEIGVFFALLFLLAILPPLGLLLIPVFLILSLLLLLLSISGLITLVVMLGDWLLRRVTRPPMPPLIAAVIGSLALSLGLSVVALLPYGFAISFILLGALTSVGLGAALFTRIGTRPVGRTYFIQG